MASEASRKKAAEIYKFGFVRTVADVQEHVAAALDEARAEGEKIGAERERWEIANMEMSGPFTPEAILDAIKRRGPMRGPEPDEFQRADLEREEANRDLSNRLRGPEEG